MKCEALNWQIDSTQKAIVASLSFTDFDQSMRFMEVLTKFIHAELRPRPILDDIAWYCPPDFGGHEWRPWRPGEKS